MIKVGDSVIQIRYDWGKREDGTYFIFVVKEYHDEGSPTFYDHISCTNDELGFVHYIPINTWVKSTAQIREEKINQLI
jgi:hypothetical protein